MEVSDDGRRWLVIEVGLCACKIDEGACWPG